MLVSLPRWWLSPHGGHVMMGLSMEMGAAMDMAGMGDVEGTSSEVSGCNQGITVDLQW